MIQIYKFSRKHHPLDIMGVNFTLTSIINDILLYFNSNMQKCTINVSKESDGTILINGESYIYKDDTEDITREG